MMRPETQSIPTIDPKLAEITEIVAAKSGLPEQVVLFLLNNGWTYYELEDAVIGGRWEKRPARGVVVRES